TTWSQPRSWSGVQSWAGPGVQLWAGPGVAVVGVALSYPEVREEAEAASESSPTDREEETASVSREEESQSGSNSARSEVTEEGNSAPRLGPAPSRASQCRSCHTQGESRSRPLSDWLRGTEPGSDWTRLGVDSFETESPKERPKTPSPDWLELEPDVLDGNWSREADTGLDWQGGTDPDLSSGSEWDGTDPVLNDLAED
ncbi:hypothetical protein J4Q44_G00274280, partial [Coregonus suidteri]